MSDVDAGIAEVFDDIPECIALFDAVHARVAELGPFDLRVSATQVAFRGPRRQFAWVWRPARWTSKRAPTAIAVSFALAAKVRDHRIVEATRVPAERWMHHVIIERDADVDDQLSGWLEEAYAAAGGR